MSKDKDQHKEEEVLKENLEETIEQAIDEVEADQEKEEISETDQLKQEVEKEKDKFLRLFAEFENYKRRTSKERVELFKTAGQDVMVSMLPVLDDFDRALKEIEKSEDENLFKGVELINNKLRETLKNKGLEPMSVKAGDKFDADLHEAITQIPAPDKKMKGKIVDVVEKGYTLGEKIIRFPKVVTGK
ncbi:nucleotide exchange factor GrpE [Mesonia aestuariivivens]|uniref:Protein GrpE n=1 Tax=Mesonia aestuariivivens TaxID=2796128 RepID=A0ABS6W509_9FLAO|nr:nucleotide exchange factor GrpE [Mesonia aestuariivivens]MBW2962576.1 nucleotide exchange factor GrpE [Mesonia aestuariivivens]